MNHLWYEQNAFRPASEALQAYVMKFRPSHRCDFETLKSIIGHGAIVSLDHIKALEHHEIIIKELKSHPQLHHHLSQLKDPHSKVVQNLVLEFASALVKQVYLINKIGFIGEDHTFRNLIQEMEKEVASHRVACCDLFKDGTFAANFERFCQKVGSAAVSLIRKPQQGIDYHVDKVYIFIFLKNTYFEINFI